MDKPTQEPAAEQRDDESSTMLFNQMLLNEVQMLHSCTTGVHVCVCVCVRACVSSEAEHTSTCACVMCVCACVQVKQNLARLDAQSYAELKSYKEPPRMIHSIVQAVLALFYPDLAEDGTFGDWNQCKPFISMDLGRKILEYDPMDATQPTKVDVVLSYLKDIPRGSVANKGSKPADYIYNWLYICMNLLEHARTTARTTNATVAPPAPAAGALSAHPSFHYCSRTVTIVHALFTCATQSPNLRLHLREEQRLERALHNSQPTGTPQRHSLRSPTSSPLLCRLQMLPQVPNKNKHRDDTTANDDLKSLSTFHRLNSLLKMQYILHYLMRFCDIFETLSISFSQYVKQFCLYLLEFFREPDFMKLNMLSVKF